MKSPHRRVLRFAFTVAAIACPAPCEIRILAVVSPANYEIGVPGPGSLATIFCTGLTNIGGIVVSTPASKLPTMLAGVRVDFGLGGASLLAPLLAVADRGAISRSTFKCRGKGLRELSQSARVPTRPGLSRSGTMGPVLP